MALANNGLVTSGKETMRTTGIKEGKGSEGGYEAGEFDIWRRSKPAFYGEWKLEYGGPLGNKDR